MMTSEYDVIAPPHVEVIYLDDDRDQADLIEEEAEKASGYSQHR
jgi:hypothetical protein